MTGTSATDYVEVYDEPLHRVRFHNEYALIYTVNIPLGVTTLWHRHQEDTMYLAVRDVTVSELMADKGPTVSHAPCGATLSRNHKAEPLIHQVTNAGDDFVHFFAVEAHAQPPLVQPAPLQAAGHELAWEAARFRVYRVAAAEAELALDYALFGVFVALGPSVLEVERRDSGRRHTVHLDAGEWEWLEPGARCHYASGARGVLAELR